MSEVNSQTSAILDSAAQDRVETVRRMAVEVSGPAARDVDHEGRFPHESMEALKRHRLLSAYVPKAQGGFGATMEELGLMCEALGQRCGSSAMIFAMHQIQVACLVRHGQNSFFRDYLASLVAEQRLIASVTSEAGVGGSVRTSISPIEREGHACRLKKEGTVVSYGEAADDLLITVRRSPEAAASDQALALVTKAQSEMQPMSTWDTMGMRGTCSVGYVIRARFGEEQIVPAPFGDINALTMVPWAHILWSSCWLGIATDAVAKARSFLRETAKKLGGTPPNVGKLSEVATQLSLLKSEVRHMARVYDAICRKPDGGVEELSGVAFGLQINHLKLAASDLAADICLRALRLTGTSGYRNDSPFSVTRNLRDALSASLMIGNERIHASTGVLQLAFRGDALADEAPSTGALRERL